MQDKYDWIWLMVIGALIGAWIGHSATEVVFRNRMRSHATSQEWAAWELNERSGQVELKWKNPNMERFERKLFGGW